MKEPIREYLDRNRGLQRDAFSEALKRVSAGIKNEKPDTDAQDDTPDNKISGKSFAV